jgi:phosphate transport system substrate-binding protein
MSRNFIRLLSVLIMAAIFASACAPGATTQAPVKSEAPVMTEAPAATTKAVAMTESPAATTEVPAATEAPAATTEAAAATEAPAATPAAAGVVALPEVDSSAVTGDIVAAGSSTVFPLAEAMAERFKNEGYASNLTIDSIGSGGGFERFCKTGETDISNASRKIKDEEVANCAALGRTPIEFRVGTDAIAVVVSSENDFLTDVTKEELARIFSKDVTKWNEVRPEWPAEDIQRFSPGTDSGTFDYFVEAIMTPAYGDDAKKGEEAILNAPGIQLSEDDNVLVQGVEGSPYAIGYFGFAYYNENQGKLKALSIGGVEPNEQTAEDNTYPLSRPLFIYSDAKIMADKPQVAAFINYFLSFVDEEIGSVGYFPASDEALNQAKQAWLNATGQ